MWKPAFLLWLTWLPLWATSYTTTSACGGPGCRWSGSDSWSPPGVPGSGDTVSIGDGHTVTVDSDAAVGTSGANGTQAVNLNVSGKLVIATGITLKVRGDVIYTAGLYNYVDAIAMQPGAVFEFDSSQATDPMNTKYVVGPSATYGFRALNASACTAQSRCTIRSHTGGGNGYFSLRGFTYGGPITARYTDFIRIGDASNPAITYQSHGYAGPYDIQHCTFTNCGQATTSNISLAAGTIFRHNYNVHSGTLAATVMTVRADLSTASSNDLRQIIGNVFDKVWGSSTFRINSFNLTDNYFGATYQVSTSGTSWSTFARNLLMGTGGPLSYAAGNVTDSYIAYNADQANPHNLMVNNNASVTISGNIFDQIGAGSGDYGDMVLHPPANPSSPTSIVITNNIVLPDARGIGAGVLLTASGDQPNAIYTVRHNTGALETGFGLVDFESGTMAAGILPYMQSNIAWAAEGQLAYQIADFTSPETTDVGTPSGIGYNSGYRLQAVPYNATWSTPPGGHDVNGDPKFVDTSRNLVTFDTAYLKNPAGVAWSSGGSYSVGDIVSDPHAAYYGGALINYRCIQAHAGITANSEPGSGSNWRTYWEFATLYRIRQAIAGQQLFTDRAIGADYDTVIMTLIKWVQAGFTPQNVALHGTGHDGGDIGAVAIEPPGAVIAPVVF